MKFLILAFGLLVFPKLQAAAQVGAPFDPQALQSTHPLIETITLESFQKTIEAMGFRCTRGKNSQGKEDDYFVFRAQGYRVAAGILSTDAVQLVQYISSPKPTLDLVNRWNKDHYFARAYIDADGDAVLESDLSLTGGVKQSNIEDFVNIFREG